MRSTAGVGRALRARPLSHGTCRSTASSTACRAVMTSHTVKLGGLDVPPLINGCWQLAGGHGREVFDNLEEKLWAHASAGYTAFDTADIYGQSESLLGQFASKWRAESSRPPLQLLTKYVPNIMRQEVTPASVEAAVRRSMQQMQVDTVDLVQLHWWDYSIPGMVDTALALADLRKQGLVANIGTTNMDCDALAQLVDAGVPVVSNQVQFSLLDRRPLNGMLQYCQAKGIKLVTYGSLGGGLLSDKYVEEPKQGLFGKPKHGTVDLNTTSLKMYWRNVSGAGQQPWRQLLQALRRVADRHPGATVANVALRWVMHQGPEGLVIPLVGLRGTEHIQDNSRALELRLDAQDMAAIEQALAELPGPQGDIYSFERGQ